MNNLANATACPSGAFHVTSEMYVFIHNTKKVAASITGAMDVSCHASHRMRYFAAHTCHCQSPVTTALTRHKPYHLLDWRVWVPANRAGDVQLEQHQGRARYVRWLDAPRLFVSQPGCSTLHVLAAAVPHLWVGVFYSPAEIGANEVGVVPVQLCINFAGLNNVISYAFKVRCACVLLCLCACVPASLCVCLSLCVPVCLASTCLRFVCVAVPVCVLCGFLCLLAYVCVSVCLCVCVSVCLCVCVSVCVCE